MRDTLKTETEDWYVILTCELEEFGIHLTEEGIRFGGTWFGICCGKPRFRIIRARILLRVSHFFVIRAGILLTPSTTRIIPRITPSTTIATTRGAIVTIIIRFRRHSWNKSAAFDQHSGGCDEVPGSVDEIMGVAELSAEDGVGDGIGGDDWVMGVGMVRFLHFRAGGLSWRDCGGGGGGVEAGPN